MLGLFWRLVLGLRDAVEPGVLTKVYKSEQRAKPDAGYSPDPDRLTYDLSLLLCVRMRIHS
jgi:hypothetical protein